MLVAPTHCRSLRINHRPLSSLQRLPCARHCAHRAPSQVHKRVTCPSFHRSVSCLAATADPQVEEEVPRDLEVEENSFEIQPDVFYVRGACTQRLKFAVQYGRKRGTTDNAYLIKGETKSSTVLIDVPTDEFSDNFVDALEEIVSLNSIGHIIMTHVDKKSLPTLEKLLERIESSDEAKVEIHLTVPGLQFLRSIMGATEVGAKLLEGCVLSVAKSDGFLDLEDGKKLQYLKASTPRWPDMFAVYFPSANLLFSSKLFSCHVAPGIAGTTEPFDTDGWGEYGDDWKFYFDCMLAPTASQVGKSFKRLNIGASPVTSQSNRNLWSAIKAMLPGHKAKSQEAETSTRFVSYLCPMHGPVIKNAVNEVLEEYGEWLDNQNKILSRVAVFYASAYGHTATMAQAISRGISKAGVGVDTVNLEIAEQEEIAEVISKSAGFVMGSPTLGGHMPTQVQSALGTILRESQAKQLPCGVFGSYGWSGEAVDEMNQRLRDGGFTFAFEPIKVKFRPSPKDVQVCEESGTDLAQTILKKEKRKSKQAAESSKARGASEAAQAAGRIVGSLCVVMAKDGESEGGMLASWVSQASFDPPGISVSVKKDRAMENLMAPGNNFNVNVLAQGREKTAVKAMTKPFGPGEDRFAGMETERSEGTGCVILPEAAAVLECTVQDLMEAGDHFVVYASVEDGKVLDNKAVSAVHHRKVGTSY